MVKDLKVDDKGDLVIDPITHDLVFVDGIEEISQRIKATLETKFGEMKNLAPEVGADYRNFIGKHVNKESAENDMITAIRAQVPEVQSIQNVDFEVKPNRHLIVNFECTAIPSESDSAEKIKEEYDFGS